MSTVAAKSPKKRKSLSNQAGTPSKTPKVEKVQTPKTNVTPSNGKQSANKGQNAKKNSKEQTPVKKNEPFGKQSPNKGQNAKKNSKEQTPVKNNEPIGKQSPNKRQNAKKNSKEQTPVKNNEPIVNGNKKLEKFKGTTPFEHGKKSTKRHLFIEKLKGISESEGKDSVAKLLNEKIEAITSRSDISKTGRKKVKDLKHLLKFMTGVTIPSKQVQSKKAPQESNKSKKAKAEKKDTSSNVKAAKTEKKKKVEPVTKDESEDDEDSEVEDEGEENVDDEDSADAEESDDGEGSEDDDDDDEDNDDDDEEEADEQEEQKTKKVIQSKAKIEPEEKSAKNTPTKNSRYVLFVANIPYDTTKEEIKEHFKRVGEVTDVRIPLDKESNKPRGFAYVELPNEASYQQALDLNGSQLKNRKIYIQYSQGGKKKSEDGKKEIKAKNFKLHAMRKQGQFGKVNKPQFKSKGKPKNEK